MPILANLLELYAHDFSEFRELVLGEDGKFGYPHLSLYWSEPNRHPFLVRVDGNLAGLVLVNRMGEIWDMAEFFIVRGARKQGIGTKVAHQVWTKFPGTWQVRVLQVNKSALSFWAQAVSKFAGKPIEPAKYEKAGEPWSHFSFQSGPMPLIR